MYNSEQRLPEVTVKPTDYLPDPEVIKHHNDLYAQAWEPNLQMPENTDSTGNRQKTNHILCWRQSIARSETQIRT